MAGNGQELFGVILGQPDYALLCLNTCAGVEPAGPPEVTDTPSNETYTSLCKKLGVTQCTQYPKTTQTVSFVPSNSKVPVTIRLPGGPPWNSPWPPQTGNMTMQHALNSINFHSWQ